jgi:hypothetical protein
MAASYVTLILDLYDAAGNQIVHGTAQVTPSAELPDPAEMMLIGQAPLTGAFRAGSLPQLRLVSTDSVGPQPNAWTYTITFSGVPGSPASFSFTDGATQYLSALAQVPAAQPGTQYVPLAGHVNMQGPLAPLDTNLVDASSVTVSAGANDYTLLLTSAVGASRTVTLSPGLDGQVLTMLLIQPASGGPCAVTWAGVDWGRAVSAPALSSSANAADLLAWKYKTALSAWRYMGIN